MLAVFIMIFHNKNFETVLTLSIERKSLGGLVNISDFFDLHSQILTNK